jgi:hypothetical protein
LFDASTDALHGTDGRMSVADGEIKRSRGYSPSGSDAAVMGRERAQHGGVSTRLKTHNSARNSQRKPFARKVIAFGAG